MHFIEQLFGFTPDKSSGLAEALVLTSLASCLVVRSFFVRARRSRKSR
jgi:hypothetical protein